MYVDEDWSSTFRKSTYSGSLSRRKRGNTGSEKKQYIHIQELKTLYNIFCTFIYSVWGHRRATALTQRAEGYLRESVV